MANAKANKKNRTFFTGAESERVLNGFLGNRLNYNILADICNKNKSGLYFYSGIGFTGQILSWASQIGNNSGVVL